MGVPANMFLNCGAAAVVLDRRTRLNMRGNVFVSAAAAALTFSSSGVQAACLAATASACNWVRLGI